MEGHGSGGGDWSRVERLERRFQDLHSEQLKHTATFQASIDALGGQMAALATVVDDVATKLDVARTRKPELGAMAAVAAVIIALGVQSLSPVNSRLERLEGAADILAQEQLRRAQIVGQFDEFRENSLSRLGRLEERIDDTQGNRFTDEDARWQELLRTIKEEQESRDNGAR